MAVSILDGTIEALELKRSARNLRIFQNIQFRLRDGSTRNMAKTIVDEKVAQYLQPGASGRFYVFNAIDHRGIHAVRDDAGHAVCVFPKVNELAMLVLVLMNLAWVGVTLVTRAGVPVLGSALLVFATVYYIHQRKLGADARRQFSADSQYVPPSTQRLEAEPAVGA